MAQFFFTYGGTFVWSFFVTLFLLASILFFSRWQQGSGKRIHHTYTAVSRLGGAAMIIGFLLVLGLSPIPSFPTSWWIFSLALIVLLIVGLWDDFKNLHWVFQLGLQFSVLTTLYLGGVQIVTLTLPIGGVLDFSTGGLAIAGFILFLLWGCLVLNAVNWLDGVDGLCASVMMVTYSTLFVLALSPAVYQPAIAILLAAALGGTLAFLVYNYPPAKIIGGTSGSLFFGIVIIFVSVVAGTKIATTLLVLALPITDTFFVLLKRLKERRSLFVPDHEHLHHILQKNGWSNRNIVLTYTFLTIGIGSIALSTQSLGKFTATLIVFGSLGLLFSFFHFQKTISQKRLIVGALVTTLLIVGVFFGSSDFKDNQNAFIAGHWYQLEVADTPLEKEQGLSGREELCIHCGMLFSYPKPTVPLFWMKDMRFSIDVLWLRDNRVVAKHENLPFPSLEAFGPEEPITKVLELPAGSIKNIPLGAKVYFW